MGLSLRRRLLRDAARRPAVDRQLRGSVALAPRAVTVLRIDLVARRPQQQTDQHEARECGCEGAPAERAPHVAAEHACGSAANHTNSRALALRESTHPKNYEAKVESRDADTFSTKWTCATFPEGCTPYPTYPAA
eukprot:5305144-Prymnesium_polylepis.2